MMIPQRIEPDQERDNGLDSRRTVISINTYKQRSYGKAI